MKQIKSQDLVGDEKQRFGFRKTTLGLCGAILASSVMVLNAGNVNHTVHAATLDGDAKQEAQDDSADKEVVQAKQDATGLNAANSDKSAEAGSTQSQAQSPAKDSGANAQANTGASATGDASKPQTGSQATDNKAQASQAGQGVQSQAGQAQTGSQVTDKSQAGQGAQSQAGSQAGQAQAGNHEVAKPQAGQGAQSQAGSQASQSSQSQAGEAQADEPVEVGGVIHENHNFGPNHQEVTFEFYDSQTGQAIQIKDPKSGKMVNASQILDGDTNDLVPIIWHLPENYKLKDGTPEDYRFTVNAGGADTNSVKGPDGQYQGTLQVGYGDPRWKHTVVDWGKNSIDGKMLVDPSKAQWGTDKDGNPLWANKNYGKDISVIHVDLDHQLKADGTDTSTVTRNITYSDPATGKDKTDKQTVTFTRPKQIDLVTGKPVYGNWDHATQVLPGVTLPAKPGYDPQSVPEITVKPGDKPADAVGKYVPHDNNVTISFKDVSANDPQNIPDKTVKLSTDENADLTPDLPKGYVVAPGQDPHYKVGTDPVQSVTVKVVHGTKDVTNDPDQYNNTHKKISYVVTIAEPNVKPIVNSQDHVFTRTASYDVVTKKVNYGAWSDNGKFTFNSVKIPTVPGYTPSGSAPAVTVTPDSSDQTLTVTYKANGQHVMINYTDQDGNVIGSQSVGGNTGDTVKINYQLPDHWVQDPSDKLPDSVVMKPDNNVPITVKVNHKLDKRDDDKVTVTRTVQITTPDGKTTSQDQSAVFTRTTQYDEVLGHNVYGNWDKQSQLLSGIAVPDIKGYAKSSDVPAVNVTPTTSSFTLKVTYKPVGGQTATIHFKDKDGNEIGKPQIITGQTGDDKTIDYNFPAGWTGDTSKLPKDVKFTGDPIPDITVSIDHKVDRVADDVRTVTRTVNITNPDGSHQDPITQSVTFTRHMGKDEVTGKNVPIGDWDKASYKFDAINIPVKSGYVSSVTAPEEVVTPDSKPETVNVTYVAGGQTNSYGFADDDNNGAKVGSDVQFAGKTGQTVDLDITVPAGYDVAKTNSVPKDYTFADKDNKPIIIHLVHHKSDASQDPNAKTTDTVSRTVEVTNPDGKTTSETESVTFTRPATKDEVTGKITYGEWNKPTQELPEMPIAGIPGYMPNSKVPAITVKPGDKPETVKVAYTASDQTNTWVFNDLDDKGNKLNSEVHTIKGKTGETVQLSGIDGIKIPDGYVLDDGETIPDSYTFLGENNKPIVITLHHGTQDITGQEGSDTSRTISRTINITKPNGKTTAITQSVTFTRTGSKDLVTGKIKYGAWSNNGKQSLAQLVTPTLDGYKANPETIPAMDVTPDSTKMTTVDVSYTALNNQQTIDYVDKAGNTVGKQEVTGKTGETVKVVPDLPSGWVIDPDGQSKIPAEVTIKDVDTPIKVSVKHGMIVLKPGESNDKYGVKDNDVNRTVTRTITVITPDQGKNDNKQSTVDTAVPATGMAKTPVEGNGNTIVQSVKFMRGAMIDEVTGQITYTDWKANGDSKFAEYDAPKISGYVAVPNVVPAEQATADYVDPKITITYIDAKEAGTQTIIYQDKDGKQVGSQDIVGKLNTDVKVLPDYPKGWTIDPDQKDKLPKTVHITDSNKPITVTVVHVLTPLDPENPGHGLSADDFHRTVTRPIVVTMPDGKDQDMSQTIHFTRGGNFDEVTHDITFTPWKGDKTGMPEVKFPEIDGKKATPNVIPAVDNVTIDSTFSPIHVEYQQNSADNDNGSWSGGVAIDNGNNNGQDNNKADANANANKDNTTDTNKNKKTGNKKHKHSLSDYERGYRDGYKAGYGDRTKGRRYGYSFGNYSGVYGNGYDSGYGAGFNGNGYGSGYGMTNAGYEGAGNGYYGYGATEYVADNGAMDNGAVIYSGSGEGAGSMNAGNASEQGMLPQTGSAKTNAMAAAALAVAAGAGILGLAGTKKRREDQLVKNLGLVIKYFYNLLCE